MKYKIYIKIFLIISLFLPQMASAIGQVTKPIVIDNALRGQSIVEELSVSNSEKEPADFGFMAVGDIAAWTSFYALDDTDFSASSTVFTIPPGPFVNIIAKFDLPDDLPNGEYKGTIYLFHAPDDGEENNSVSMKVAQRIGREVTINVTDQEIIKFSSSIIPVHYQVDEKNPVEIKIIHSNEGNVSIEPSVQLKIIRKDASVYNAIFPFPEDQEPIKPGERRVMPENILWDTHGREIGNYRAEIAIMVGDKVYNDSKFGFVIGDIENAKEEYKKEKDNWSMFAYISKPPFNMIGLSFLILIIVGIWYFKSFYKKRNEANLATIDLKK